MTSVPNHHRLLNGSKHLLLVIGMAILLFQCKSKKIVSHPSPKDPIEEQETLDPHLPEDTSLVINPSIPDTNHSTIEIPTRDNQNKVAVFMPLDIERMLRSGDGISGKDLAILQYYAGFMLAMDKLRERNMKLEISIMPDAEIDDYLMKCRQLKRDRPIVLMGGTERTSVEKIAQYARDMKTFYLSNWTLRAEYIGANDYYVQLNPGFRAHVLNILQHALQEYEADQIHLIGTSTHAGRMKEINRLYQELTNDTNGLDQMIIPEDKLLNPEYKEPNEESIDENAPPPLPQVYIISETNDFDFIQALFRYIELMHLHEHAVFYGITPLNNQRLYSYLNNYDVRLSSFWDPSVMDIYDDFHESYFNKMHELPNEMAYQGYTHGLLMGDFAQQLKMERPTYRMTLVAPGCSAHFVDHNELVNPRLDKDKGSQSYWENNALLMLGFEDFRYYQLNRQ